MSKVEFEWISDEEREWRQRRSDAAPPSWPWRRWLAAFLLLIALAAAGLYWREQRALHTIEADVQRAHDLLLAGAQAGDIDLLRRMIVQSDPAWTQAWLDLARGRGWLDRGSWGMTLAAAPPDLRSVTLTPDLSEAETLTQATFSAAAIAAGQPFTLTLPAVFTYTAQGRWLFAPPRATWWGERKMSETARLRFYYPQRDSEILRRLLADFDLALQQRCRPRGDYDCGNGEPIAISFSTSPITLARFASLHPYYTETGLLLPTPSLLGLPLDQTGYEALRAGYARRLFSLLFADFTGYECCAHILYFSALIERELADLGWAAWPLTPPDYAELLTSADIAFNLRVDVGWDLSRFEEATAVQWRAALAIVEFILAADPALTPARLLNLIGPRWQLHTTWLEQIAALNSPVSGLGRDWQPQTRGDIPGIAIDNGNSDLYRFLFQAAQLPVLSPPQPFPAAAVVLACQDEGATLLLRYQPAADAWSEWQRLPEIKRPFIAGLPQQDQVWLIDQAATGDVATWLWAPAGLQPVAAQPLQLAPEPAHSGRRLIASSLTAGAAFYEVDLDRCAASGCALTPARGYTRWSPDDRHRLVRDRQNWERILLLDASGQIMATLTGDFSAAAWLDAESFVWSDGAFLYRRGLDSDLIEVLLAADEVGAAAPVHIQEGFQIVSVQLHPAQPRRLLLTLLVDAVVDLFYVVAYDLDSAALTYVDELGQVVLFEPAITGRGAFLAGFGFTGDRQRYRLLVYDAGLEQAYLYPLHTSFEAPATQTWEQGGDWLLLFGGGMARLIAPRHDYQHLALPPLSTCTSAAWLATPLSSLEPLPSP